MKETGTQAIPAPAVRKVPGSAASSVRADSLWKSQIRWMLKSPSGALRSFAFSLFSRQAGKGDTPCTPRPVWPMPVPGLKKDDKKLDADEAASLASLQAMIIVLNWLHLGQPRKVPSGFEPHAKPTPEQRAVVARLKRLGGEWRDFRTIGADEMGRSAGKFETLEETVQLLTQRALTLAAAAPYGRPEAKTGRTKTTSTSEKGSLFADVQLAKEIEADRLKFSGRPAFNSASYLDEKTKAWYEDPLTLSIDPQDAPEPPPHVTVRGNRKEVLKLLAALDRTGRLALFAPEQVRMQRRAGVFCLMKNLTTDRLILDSRPANTLEEPLNHYTQTMAAITPMLDWTLQPDEVIVAAGEDLRDYYYFYQVSEARAARNALAFDLTETEARQFEAFNKVTARSKRYVPALNTMAMGDVNAVEYGQQAHVMLALQTGLRFADLMTLRGQLPRQDVLVGLVIDDFICVEKMPKELIADKQLRSSAIADAMVEAYKSAGLQPNDGKRFRVGC